MEKILFSLVTLFGELKFKATNSLFGE